MEKIITHLLSFDVWLLVRQIGPVKHSQCQTFLLSNARTASEDAIFSQSTSSLLITGKVPREVWAWDISGPRKELKSVVSLCVGAIFKCFMTSSYIQFWLWTGREMDLNVVMPNFDSRQSRLRECSLVKLIYGTAVSSIKLFRV